MRLAKQVLDKVAKENNHNDSWNTLKKHWLEIYPNDEVEFGFDAEFLIDKIEHAVELALETKQAQNEKAIEELIGSGCPLIFICNLKKRLVEPRTKQTKAVK